MLALIYFILILGLIVFIHELGHFIFARKRVFIAMNFLWAWVLKYILLGEKMMKPLIQ